MTIGASNFESVISNVAPAGALILGTGRLTLGPASRVASSVITQVLDKVKVKDTSQSINSVSNLFQKVT